MTEEATNALEYRLTSELDAPTAKELVRKIGSALLDWSPPSVAPTEIGSLVVFAFGNRVESDGTVLPGPVNSQLADVTQTLAIRLEVPVFAQWEVADLLIGRGVERVFSIRPDVAPDGSTVYLNTERVAQKAVEMAAAEEVTLGQVGVVAFRDHAVRCVAHARGVGMESAAIPEGVVLPCTYDPQSGQPWTRYRVAYVLADIKARLSTIS